MCGEGLNKHGELSAIVDVLADCYLSLKFYIGVKKEVLTGGTSCDKYEV